jgi:hypothetical protein
LLETEEQLSLLLLPRERIAFGLLDSGQLGLIFAVELVEQPGTHATTRHTTHDTRHTHTTRTTHAHVVSAIELEEERRRPTEEPMK